MKRKQFLKSLLGVGAAVVAAPIIVSEILSGGDVSEGLVSRVDKYNNFQPKEWSHYLTGKTHISSSDYAAHPRVSRITWSNPIEEDIIVEGYNENGEVFKEALKIYNSRYA